MKILPESLGVIEALAISHVEQRLKYRTDSIKSEIKDAALRVSHLEDSLQAAEHELPQRKEEAKDLAKNAHAVLAAANFNGDLSVGDYGVSATPKTTNKVRYTIKPCWTGYYEVSAMKNNLSVSWRGTEIDAGSFIEGVECFFKGKQP